MGARLLGGEFKENLTQALNFEAYLTHIDLELHETMDHAEAAFHSGPLYHTLTESRSTHSRRIFTPLGILQKRYAKLFTNKTDELK